MLVDVFAQLVRTEPLFGNAHLPPPVWSMRASWLTNLRDSDSGRDCPDFPEIRMGFANDLPCPKHHDVTSIGA
jgi:hypothetical protein